MSYERMKKREAELKAEVARMLAAAERRMPRRMRLSAETSAATNCRIGPATSRSGWRRSAGDGALEAEAKLEAEEERRIEAEKNSSAKPKPQKPGKPAAPPSTNQIPSRNATSPIRKARIMKSKDGLCRPIMHRPPVDAGAQIIVAHELTQCGNDQGQLVPLIEAIENNLGRKPQQASADSGYCSESNLKRSKHMASTAMSRPDAPNTDGRERENWRTADPTDAKQDRRRRLETPYRLRKQVVEPGRTDSNRHVASASSCCGASRKCALSGDDLHRPQPPEAVHHRNRRLSRLPCNNVRHKTYLDGLLAGQAMNRYRGTQAEFQFSIVAPHTAHSKLLISRALRCARCGHKPRRIWQDL